MDERTDNYGYQTSHYQGLRWSAIILEGRIHYQPRYTAHWARGWTTIDLYTGETLFLDYDATMPSFGQIYNYESPNQHGGFAYLWRTSDVTLPINITRDPRTGPDETINITTRSGTQTWEMIDAFTGNRICYVANVSASGTSVYGKDGSILRYSIANLGTRTSPNYYLQLWNTSAIDTMLAGDYSTDVWQWRPQYGGHSNYVYRWREHLDAVHDGDTGFSLNVSLPNIESTSIRAVREGEYIIVGSTGSNNEDGIEKGKLVTLSLEDGKEGQRLDEVEFTPPFASTAANVSVAFTGVYPEYGVMVFEDRKNLIRWGFSLDTGQQLWESAPEPQLHYYGMSDMVYQGLLLASGSYGGELLAYNLTTGEIEWRYIPENVGFESPYGNYPMRIGAIADGKIYIQTSEHSPTQPLWRGPNLRCINATDGTEIWTILDYGTGMAIADGLLVEFNNFDNELYCFGKGPSATTVTASPKVSVYGDGVMIEGTVTDDSPSGRRTTTDIVDFTLKGSPAISDEDMSAWMEYMFMQQARPENAKGVEVVLETLDPNGNFYEIGRTTSDINGNYGLKFTPEVPGEYQIFTTFAGSKSYGPSYASTYLSVEEAPQATPTAPPPEPSMADLYFMPATIGIIVAIVAVGLVLVLLLRKR